MTRSALLALAACTFGLSGCVGLSRSSPVDALSADWASGARIDEIVVVRDEVEVSPDFDETFRSRVKAKLDRCAMGTRPIRLEARISRLDKANVVMTAVIGGANVLRGEARLVDMATGRAVGEYQVGQTIVGGRVAVFKMAEAEEQLSDAFGDELCKQAFPTAR